MLFLFVLQDNLFVLHRLVSAENAKVLTAGRHRPVVIPAVAHGIGVRFVMNRFIRILVTAEMSGSEEAFSRPHSISSRPGRCPQEKGFGHQSSVAIQLNMPVIPAAHEVGCIV